MSFSIKSSHQYLKSTKQAETIELYDDAPFYEENVDGESKQVKKKTATVVIKNVTKSKSTGSGLVISTNQSCMSDFM